jgi:hypothetical protein
MVITAFALSGVATKAHLSHVGWLLGIKSEKEGIVASVGGAVFAENDILVSTHDLDATITALGAQ